MRKYSVILIALLTLSGTAAGNPAPQPQAGPGPLAQGELLIEIHPTATELLSTGEPLSVDIEGIASAIGGVRYLDIMFVLDTSMSLRNSDPSDFRSAGSIGLIENLSPKSDTKIGVVSFSDSSKLTQPLTKDRGAVIFALQGLKRAGGTNIAAGIRTALAELQENGRPGSSRVILLITLVSRAHAKK